MIQNPIRMMKPGDFLLITVLLLSGTLPLIQSRYHQASAARVSVSVESQPYSTLSLQTDSVYTVTGRLGISEFKVSDHSVCMLQSPCPHKTCINMGRISQTGQIIVCVPNQILIRIDGDDSHDLDGVTQ